VREGVVGRCEVGSGWAGFVRKVWLDWCWCWCWIFFSLEIGSICVPAIRVAVYQVTWRALKVRNGERIVGNNAIL